MRTTLLVPLLLVVVAGCGSASSPVTPPAAAPTQAVKSVSPAPSPIQSPAKAKLTISQARRAYVSIVDRSNRLLDAISQDYTDRVPIAQYRQDQLASIAALRVMASKLAAIRWPRRVEPYIRAMLSTDVVADVRCARDQAKVNSYSQANVVSYDQNCTAAQNTSNADTIRSLLRLPPVGG